jgi:hypothetical protein
MSRSVQNDYEKARNPGNTRMLSAREVQRLLKVNIRQSETLMKSADPDPLELAAYAGIIATLMTVLGIKA